MKKKDKARLFRRAACLIFFGPVRSLVVFRVCGHVRSGKAGGKRDYDMMTDCLTAPIAGKWKEQHAS